MTDQENFYQSLLDNIADGVYFVDLNRRITYWNKGAERITGYKAEEVVGKSCMDNLLNHVNAEGRMLCKEGCPLTACMASGEPCENEVFLHHAGGQRVPVYVQTAPIRNAQGEIVGGVETFSKASPARADQLELAELRHKSDTDALTGLRNRAYVDRFLRGLLSAGEGSTYSLGVLFIDVDKFKEVNDTFGHEAGDRVLKMVSETIRNNLRKTDVVGRWGGDEFIAIVQDVASVEELREIAEKIRMLVGLSRLDLEEGSAVATVTIGGKLARKGASSESLLKRADELMYRMKRSGRNRVEVE
jgi:diguanylate cyclase (GGDEF)-like protein/PAS domain S-box-containing protein